MKILKIFAVPVKDKSLFLFKNSLNDTLKKLEYRIEVYLQSDSDDDDLYTCIDTLLERFNFDELDNYDHILYCIREVLNATTKQNFQHANQ